MEVNKIKLTRVYFPSFVVHAQTSLNTVVLKKYTFNFLLRQVQFLCLIYSWKQNQTDRQTNSQRKIAKMFLFKEKNLHFGIEKHSIKLFVFYSYLH